MAAKPELKMKMTKSRAADQRQYRAHDKVGLKYFPGLGFVEPGLVEFVIRSVSPKLDHLPVGQVDNATLKRVLTEHLRTEWVEPWRPDWLESGGESAALPPCLDLTSPLWLWAA